MDKQKALFLAYQGGAMMDIAIAKRRGTVIPEISSKQRNSRNETNKRAKMARKANRGR